MDDSILVPTPETTMHVANTSRGLATLLMLPLMIAAPARAQSPDFKAGPSDQEMQAVANRGIAYLKASQGQDGSFSPKVAGPGVSALVAASLLKHGLTPQDPIVARTLSYLETQVQKDGGIYDRGLANYTTSVALVAFAQANRNGRYDTVIANARNFLKKIQHQVEESDPAHGGFSYDGKKSPDLSNTGFSIDALIIAGIPKDDPALKRAMRFVSRAQNLPGEYNDQPFAQKATPDDAGGFTYNPLAGSDSRHKTPDGGLRSLGAMTYTGLKTFLYAGVSRDDPRVKAAVGWIRRHYTLEENPGLGKAGLFYYYHTFAKAMHALGGDTFEDAQGKSHPWRRELFDALQKRQNADGSWQNTGDRTFAEENRDLATAFALLSLSYCRPK